MPLNGSAEPSVRYSVCATNYNCAHALVPHLESIFRGFDGRPFEYVVVDNHSRDASWEILQSWAASHPNMTLLRRRCTMGRGRNLGVVATQGSCIAVVDTDVVYRADLFEFVSAWERTCPDLAVQAPFLGLFPRAVWDSVGGRRSLNTYEDVDMWLRIHETGKMRWYLVPAGENLKEAEALGGGDYASRRYPRRERVLRLLRREWDLWKTRRYEGVDIEGIIHAKTVDFGIGTPLDSWVKNRPTVTAGQRALILGRLLSQVLRS